MKRGRPPLPPERRRHVRVSVAVRADVADAVFVYAEKQDITVSQMVNRLFERLAQRESELTTYQKSDPIGVIAR